MYHINISFSFLLFAGINNCIWCNQPHRIHITHQYIVPVILNQFLCSLNDRYIRKCEAFYLFFVIQCGLIKYDSKMQYRTERFSIERKSCEQITEYKNMYMFSRKTLQKFKLSNKTVCMSHAADCCDQRDVIKKKKSTIFIVCSMSFNWINKILD